MEGPNPEYTEGLERLPLTPNVFQLSSLVIQNLPLHLSAPYLELSIFYMNLFLIMCCGAMGCLAMRLYRPNVCAFWGR